MDISCLGSLHSVLFATWILGPVMRRPYDVYLVFGLVMDLLGVVSSHLTQRQKGSSQNLVAGKLCQAGVSLGK
jgi:hypothetical protein